MKRPFNEIIKNLTETINYYDYFVDFKKVFNNVSNIEYKLNTLNYLLGKDNFDKEFTVVFSINPEVIEVLPILLAIRDKELSILDSNIIKYQFNRYMNVKEYLTFIHKTGLIELFKDKRIKNLVDYVTGVEVGLDTNGRKNRTGTQMELIVKKYLNEVSDIKYIEQASFTKIKEELGIDVVINSSEISQNKRFDFAVIGNNNILYLIETNYYKTSGSKLNETSRSYSKLDTDISGFSNVEFIWITDGFGWLTTKKDFKHAYDTIKHVYTIYDLKNNVLNKLFNK